MEFSEILKIANSWPVWLCAFSGTAMVLIQTVLFARLAFKNAPGVGLTKEDCKRGFKSGLISSIGPSMSVFILVFSMVSIIGGPLTWMRLSIIGGADTELTAATIGAKAAGAATLGGEGYGIEALATSWWTMAINGCGWLAMVALTTHKMGQLREKISGGDPKWMNVFTAAATLGLFAYLMVPYILQWDSQCISTLLGAAVMMLLMYLSRKVKWLKEYALGFTIIIGLIVGAIMESI